MIHLLLFVDLKGLHRVQVEILYNSTHVITGIVIYNGYLCNKYSEPYRFLPYVFPCGTLGYFLLIDLSHNIWDNWNAI